MNEVLKHYCKVLEEIIYYKYNPFDGSKEQINLKYFPRYRPLQQSAEQNQNMQGVVNFISDPVQRSTLCASKEINIQLVTVIYCNGRVDDIEIDDYTEKVINSLKSIQQKTLSKYRIVGTTSVELAQQPGQDSNNNEVYEIKANVKLVTL